MGRGGRRGRSLLESSRQASSMSNLLEAGQVGLVVVAVAHDSDDVTASLSGECSGVVSESILVDLVSEFRQAAGET